jgi:hypothetical protein
MKSSLWRATLAAIIGSNLVLAQGPSVQITNVASGLTLSITYNGGLFQLDTSTFGFYLDGADVTAAYVAFVASGSPLVTTSVTPTNLTIVVAANATAFKVAAVMCTFNGVCGGAGVVIEPFTHATQHDATFVPPLGQHARWNDLSALGQLAGRALAGSPTGTSPATLGTRVQYTVDPLPNSTNPAGLFAPFDASLATSGNQCPGIPTGCNLGLNPNGGSHLMHLYESADLSNVEDSLEQIEWSPVSGVTTATTYPQYRIWCGVSNIAAPLSGGFMQGLNAVYDSNYTLLPYQTGIPVPATCSAPTLNGRKVPCGGPVPYTVALATTSFYPFPTLNPCFDFSTASGASGAGVNLIFEQNIEPGNQAPNFNRYRATFFTPVRRLIDGPISGNPPGLCPFNHGGTFDIYKMRFTFVGLVGQSRSLWYDTGGANPFYLSFIPTAPVAAQPAGTQSTWILEGTDASNPGPGTNGAAGIYINAAGTTFPSVLSTTIGQLRYFRFRVELRGNNFTNATPAYDKVVMVYHF